MNNEFKDWDRDNNYDLCQKYPYLKPHNSWDGTVDKDYDYSYTEADNVPLGWRMLFLQMCEDIRQPLIDARIIDSFYFIEVKEKYNSLRIDCCNAPKNVSDIFSKYEYLSQFVCQKCGQPATWETTKGWIASYCDDCVGKDKDHSRPIKFDPQFRIKTFSKDTIITETIDVSDEWERLQRSIKDSI